MSISILQILKILLVSLDVLIFIALFYISIVRAAHQDIKPDRDSPTLVILPCRGLDFHMEENLQSLRKQDHQNFRIVAVVDTESDPSVALLKKFGIQYLVSEGGNGSGKVSAIATAMRKFSGQYKYTVIADSDILPPPGWLSSLIAPLSQRDTGLSTTFPHFRPESGFWPKVKMVWGFVGLGMMESPMTRFGWGGSLAFRSDLLDTDNLEFFSSHVSDDIALTKICKKKGLSIAYVPEASPDIVSPDNFKVFWEWANRQTALSVSSSDKVLIYGLLFYGGTIFLFLTSFLWVFLISPLFTLLFLPSIINAGRSAKRSRNHKIAGFLLQFLIPFIYFLNLVKGGRMKEISWRGKSYRLMRKHEP